MIAQGETKFNKNKQYSHVEGNNFFDKSFLEVKHE